MAKTVPPAIGFIIEHFQEVDDPRIERTKKHPLMNVLVISLCAVVCGAKGWDEIADFGEDHEDWLGEFLALEAGTPSADTIRRVFEMLDPREFEEAFRAWVQALGRELTGQQIAIDGKSVKRAVDAAHPTFPLHLLHVWAIEQGLLLAQKSVPGAPGEVRAAQEILRELDIKGATITTDANSCTAGTTKAICEGGADYVLALKGNRGTLHAFVQEQFAAAETRRFRGVPKHVEKSAGHGRREERIVRAIEIPTWPVHSGWTGLRSAVLVDRKRRVGATVTTERAYFVTSRCADASKLSQLIRSHWQIENGLHWCLDVAFSEDDRNIRDKIAAENIALVSRIALMLLKRTPGPKKDMSLVRKQKSASRRTDFLLRVLAAGIPEN